MSGDTAFEQVKHKFAEMEQAINALNRDDPEAQIMIDEVQERAAQALIWFYSKPSCNATVENTSEFLWFLYWECRQLISTQMLEAAIGIPFNAIIERGVISPAYWAAVCTCGNAFVLETRTRIELPTSRYDLLCAKCARALYLTKMPYRDYLQTPEWQNKRAEKLNQAHHRCELCYSNKRLHVHHKTYARRGKEDLSDLIVLCANCHAKFHDKTVTD